MKKLILAAAVATVALSGGAAIRWLEKDYDFGLFKEVGGPKTGTSRFVNLGPDTIAIMDVRPSCGCTSADFTPTPLLPGDTAVIHYTYDPNMRPGKFEKSVRVTLSDNTKQIIRIRGNVLGTPESLATLYPVEAGPLRLSDRIIAFGEVTYGRTPVAFLNAYVLSGDSVIPSLHAPTKALNISPSTDKAGPGDIVTFTINFNSRDFGKYGPIEIPLAGDDISAGIKATAVVIPDVNDLRLHQQGKSPVFDIDTGIIDLGNLGDAPVQGEFTVFNNGKAPLELLSVYPSTDAITIGKLPAGIKPGKSAKVKFTVDPSRLNAGPQRQSIELMTNDPVRPRVSLPVALTRQ